MKIIVTNDDGINSPGLREMVLWCRKLGEVTVVAPKYEQSGRSQGIVIDRPFEVVESDVFSDLGIRAVSIDASPADCIRFAMDRFNETYDMAFSGLNNGINLGHDIGYSGTVGAAFEANYAGIKAISVSTVFGNVGNAAKELDKIWDFLTKNRALERCTLFNVNVPENPAGILFTEQGNTFYRDHFVEKGGNMFRAQYYVTRKVEGARNKRIDIDAMLLGYINVTPLTTKRTDYAALELLREGANGDR
ncbi:MAG: 5'/3'-nucleotidase SurE [Clostridia bacterium]|nr:5'/3'-nucleotidase SurE [Clostridia bacterium]